MLERYVKVEEALAKAGLNTSSLYDPTLIPKLIGNLISDRTWVEIGLDLEQETQIEALHPAHEIWLGTVGWFLGSVNLSAYVNSPILLLFQ